MIKELQEQHISLKSTYEVLRKRVCFNFLMLLFALVNVPWDLDTWWLGDGVQRWQLVIAGLNCLSASVLLLGVLSQRHRMRLLAVAIRNVEAILARPWNDTAVEHHFD